MSELTPYVKDKIKCNYCTEQAEFYCPYCKMLGQPQNVCYAHAKHTHKGLHCPDCNQKLHRIPPRFIGSYRKMRKYIENRPYKEMKAPNIHGIDERDNRMPRSEL